MGRIEILTKPGSDRYRGQASFNFNDDKLNSRNPFAPNRPPHQSRQYGANFGGPITKKKSSFFVDFEKRDVDDEAVVNAVILDPSLNVTPFSDTVPIPNRRTTFSPRVDYQINANNTLVARYSYTHSSRTSGVGGFSLASQKYDSTNTEQSVRLTETAVINKKIVNETRFSFEHQVSSQNGNNSIPTINVADSFTDGGSSAGQSSSTQNQIELQNNTSFTMGRHSLKIGGRMRYVSITDISRQNFGGSWTFTSIDGSPLSGVSIREAGTNMGPARMMTGMEGSGSTDPNGEYTIEAIDAGEKTFTFSRQGYLAEDRTINLSGREARLDVQLGHDAQRRRRDGCRRSGHRRIGQREFSE